MPGSNHGCCEPGNGSATIRRSDARRPATRQSLPRSFLWFASVVAARYDRRIVRDRRARGSGGRPVGTGLVEFTLHCGHRHAQQPTYADGRNVATSRCLIGSVATKAVILAPCLGHAHCFRRDRVHLDRLPGLRQPNLSLLVPSRNDKMVIHYGMAHS
jgi:hypothetical protein